MTAAVIDGKAVSAQVRAKVAKAVEAMKAKHDVKAPCGGKVLTIGFGIGADIESGQPIMTIGG